MFKQEFRRLLQHRMIFVFFMSLFLLYALFQGSSLLNKTNQAINDELYSDTFNEATYHATLDYTSGLNRAQSYVLSRLEFKQQYHQRIEKDFENLQNLKASSLYAQNRTKIDSALEQATYALSLTPTIVNDTFFLAVVTPGYGVLILLVMAAIFVYLLFGEDQQVKINRLFQTTKSGSKALFTRKACLLGALLFLSSMAFMLVDVTVLHVSNIPWNAPLQMVLSFSDSPLELTLFTYMLVYGLIRFLLVTIIAFLFLACMLFFKKLMMSVAAFLFFFLIEYLVAFFMPANSSMNLFKTINIYSILFEHPLPATNLLTMKAPFGLVILLVLILVGCYILAEKLYVRTDDAKTRGLTKSLSYKSLSLWRMQGVVIFIQKRALLILTLVFFYSLYSAVTFTVKSTGDKVAKQAVQLDYVGAIDDALLSRLAQKKEAIIQAKLTIDELTPLLNADTLSASQKVELNSAYEQIQNESAFLQVVNEITMIKDSGGTEYFLNEGYSLFFSKESPFYLFTNFLFVSLLLILCVAYSVVSDYQSNIVQLFNSTRSGKNRLIKINLVHFSVISIVAGGLIYGFNFWKINHVYPMQLSALGAATIFSIHTSLTMIPFLVLFSLNHLLVFFVIIVLAYRLSQHYDFLVVLTLMVLFLASQIGLYMMNPTLGLVALLSYHFASGSVTIGLTYGLVFVLLISQLYRLFYPSGFPFMKGYHLPKKGG